MAKIAILYGSVRSGRQGIKAARFIARQLAARKHETTLLDPEEYPLPFLDKMRKEYEPGEAPAMIEKIGRILEEADGFVVVSGEWNHGLPAVLKNMLDHYQSEYSFKPAGIVTYSAGPFGGVRAGTVLRAVLGELGMVTPSTMFAVSKVQDTFDEAGNALEQAYEQRVASFLDEFEWYVTALQNARREGTPF